MNSPVEEIKNRLDVVEVIGSYIKLQKAGANYRAVCPFHSEKKPSFFVSPVRQIWHCFGCSSGGDIFKFVMQIEGIEFGDALRMLAQKAGVELKRERMESAVLKTERQRLYEICELATRFFEKQLEESLVGKEAKNYLLGRGISEESIKKWQIGYSPDTWQGLSDFLVSKDYKKEEIEKAGLTVKNEQGGYYDRFRGRIIFPVFDLNSQVVGYGGRVFKEKDKGEIAKYVNTPNTALYDKSRILYGLDRAKVAIRKENVCVLVEGYTDTILSHQAGVLNVVSVSGTALTPFQLKILKRYTENLLIGFDMDIAGDTATKKGIDLAINQGFNVKVITMPEDMDPADVISKNPEDWKKIIQQDKSILDFYFETTFAKFDRKGIDGKKQISKNLLPVIKKIPNQIEQSFWVQKLATELEAKEEDILKEMAKVKIEEDVYGLEPEEVISLPSKSRKELLEERLLTMILKFPQNINIIKETDICFFSPQTAKILEEVKKNQNISQKDFSEELADCLNLFFLKAEIEELAENDALLEAQICLREIQSMETRNKLEKISLEIKKAEEDKDFKKIEELTKEFHQLTKEICEK